MDAFSKHIFLFPFKFEVEPNSKGKKKQKEAERNYKFIEYIENIYKSQEEEDKATYYNEKKYFHDFTHQALFPDKNNPDNLIYSVKKELNSIYRICINKKKHEKIKEGPLKILTNNEPKEIVFELISIDLQLRNIQIDLYKEGIGILSFHMEYCPTNNVSKEEKLENVLMINQYGRRISPPFLDLKYEDFGKFEYNNEKKRKVFQNSIDEVYGENLLNPLAGTKHRELAESISIFNQGCDPTDNDICDWKEFNNIAELDLNSLHYIPKHILRFLELKRTDKKDENRYLFEIPVNNKKKQNKYEMTLEPILDDRMFVMCWLGVEQLNSNFAKDRNNLIKEKDDFGYVLSDLCQRKHGGYEAGGFYRNFDQNRTLAINKSFDGYGYITNDFWYKYIFVDGDAKSCQSETMQEKLAEKHTYDRWVEYNTLYGVSRYSFNMISAPLKELRKPANNAAFVVEYFQTAYFKMVSLALVQRSMILKYSKIINNYYSCEKSVNEEDKLETYPNYLRFINNYFFREISTQEQGIELYDMLIEQLRIENQAKELEKEYDELYRLNNIESTRKSATRMKIFTVIASIIAIPSVLNGFLIGDFFKNLQPYSFFARPNWSTGYFTLFLVAITSSLVTGFLNWRNDKKCMWIFTKGQVSIFLIILGTLLMIFYLITFQYFKEMSPPF